MCAPGSPHTPTDKQLAEMNTLGKQQKESELFVTQTLVVEGALDSETPFRDVKKDRAQELSATRKTGGRDT